MEAGIICATALEGGKVSELAAGLLVGPDTASLMRGVLGFSGLEFRGRCTSGVVLG